MTWHLPGCCCFDENLKFVDFLRRWVSPMNSLSWLNRGLSTDDCRKASDMQKCLSNGGSMAKNHAFHCSSEVVKKSILMIVPFVALHPTLLISNGSNPGQFRSVSQLFSLHLAIQFQKDFANFLYYIFINNIKNYEKTVFLDGVSPSLAGVSPI